MKCRCYIHKEMHDAAMSIWMAAVVAFAWLFLVMDLDFVLNNVLYWWVSAVTLRPVAVETVRFVLLKRI